MAKKNKIKGFIIDCRHDGSSECRPEFFQTYEEAVNEVHDFFLSYGFEVRDGRPFDSGHENDSPGHEEDGFKCFDNIDMHGDKVAGFMHCDGDGPVADIHKQE